MRAVGDAEQVWWLDQRLRVKQKLNNKLLYPKFRSLQQPRYWVGCSFGSVAQDDHKGLELCTVLLTLMVFLHGTVSQERERKSEIQLLSNRVGYMTKEMQLNTICVLYKLLGCGFMLLSLSPCFWRCCVMAPRRCQVIDAGV